MDDLLFEVLACYYLSSEGVYILFTIHILLFFPSLYLSITANVLLTSMYCVRISSERRCSRWS